MFLVWMLNTVVCKNDAVIDTFIIGIVWVISGLSLSLVEYYTYYCSKKDVLKSASTIRYFFNWYFLASYLITCGCWSVSDTKE